MSGAVDLGIAAATGAYASLVVHPFGPGPAAAAAGAVFLVTRLVFTAAADARGVPTPGRAVSRVRLSGPDGRAPGFAAAASRRLVGDALLLLPLVPALWVAHVWSGLPVYAFGLVEWLVCAFVAGDLAAVEAVAVKKSLGKWDWPQDSAAPGVAVVLSAPVLPGALGHVKALPDDAPAPFAERADRWRRSLAADPSGNFGVIPDLVSRYRRPPDRPLSSEPPRPGWRRFLRSRS